MSSGLLEEDVGEEGTLSTRTGRYPLTRTTGLFHVLPPGLSRVDGETGPVCPSTTTEVRENRLPGTTDTRPTGDWVGSVSPSQKGERPLYPGLQGRPGGPPFLFPEHESSPRTRRVQERGQTPEWNWSSCRTDALLATNSAHRGCQAKADRPSFTASFSRFDDYPKTLSGP